MNTLTDTDIQILRTQYPDDIDFGRACIAAADDGITDSINQAALRREAVAREVGLVGTVRVPVLSGF